MFEHEIIIEIDEETNEDIELFNLSDKQANDDGTPRPLKVRLDKWLWAARFFKTRALARAAVENGKVSYNFEPSKPSREIELGAVLEIRVGRIEKTVTIVGLSTRRHSTEKAEELYVETDESKKNRESNWHSDGQFISPYGQHNTNKPVRFLRRTFTRNEDMQFASEMPAPVMVADEAAELNGENK